MGNPAIGWRSRVTEDVALSLFRTFAMRSAALAAALALTLTPQVAVGAATGVAPWPQFQRDGAHTGAVASGPQPPYRVAWTYRPGARSGQFLSSPVAASQVVVVAGPDGLYAADLRSGSERWSVTRDGPPVAPAVATIGGTEAVLYTDGRAPSASVLAAVDAATGRPIWKQPLRLQAASRSGVTVSGDRAFVGDQDGNVYGVSLADASMTWPSPAALPDPAIGPMAVAGDTLVAVTGSTSTRTISHVVALDTATGKMRWDVTPDQTASFASLPTVSGDTVVVALPNGVVYGLSLADGSQVWSARINALVSPFVAPTMVDGAVLVDDTTGGLRRIVPAAGQDWLFAFNESALRASPLGVGGSVVVGLGDGSLGVVDARTGRMTWQGAGAVASVTGLAVTSDEVLGVRSGAGRPEVLALQHDSSGALVDVASPTVPVGSVIAGRFGAVFVVVGALLLLTFRGVLRRVHPVRDPSVDDAGNEVAG